MLTIIGTFFLDLAKLIFAGVIVVGIMRQDIAFSTLLLRGGAAMLLAAALGFSAHIFAQRFKSKKS